MRTSTTPTVDDDMAQKPKLVQTTAHTPALVHAGPFANIAHGTSSLFAQRVALRLADYVVNETGFGADLGAEQYFDVVMPSSGLRPSVAVLITSARALGEQGSWKAIKKLSDLGFGHLPVCMAKTQSSLSDNPKLTGAPQGWTFTVTDAHLAAGAGQGAAGGEAGRRRFRTDHRTAVKCIQGLFIRKWLGADPAVR